MNWKNKLNSMFKPSQEVLKKQVLLKLCDLKEVEKIYKEYINPKPTYVYEDDNGIERRRYPKRHEFEEGIVRSVPLESMVKIIPKLNKQVKEWEKEG